MVFNEFNNKIQGVEAGPVNHPHLEYFSKIFDLYTSFIVVNHINMQSFTTFKRIGR